MCQIDSVSPGENGLKAHFGETIALTGVFGIAPGQVELLSAGQVIGSLPLTLAWTPAALAVKLPATASPAPHGIRVVVSPSESCTRPIAIDATGLPPSDGGVGSALDVLLSQITLTVAETLASPGDTVHAMLQNMPVAVPGGAITVAGRSRWAARPGLGRVGLAGSVLEGPGAGAETLPQGVDVAWDVLQDGQPLPAGDRYTDAPAAATTGILMVPPIEELRAVAPMTPAGPVPTPREILAHVTLTAPAPLPGGAVSRARDLTAPIELWPLRVPRIAAFFENPDYGGHLFLMAPATSPYDGLSEAMRRLPTLLATIATAGDKLERIAWFGSITAGVTTLKTALEKKRRVVMRSQDRIGSLHPVIWEKVYTTDALGLDPDWNAGDVTDEDSRVENRLSSMIFIGVGGRRIDCFSSKHYHGRWLEVRIDRPVAAALIPTLHTPNPTSTENGVTILPHENDTEGFGNTFNSIQFG